MTDVGVFVAVNVTRLMDEYVTGVRMQMDVYWIMHQKKVPHQGAGWSIKSHLAFDAESSTLMRNLLTLFLSEKLTKAQHVFLLRRSELYCEADSGKQCATFLLDVLHDIALFGQRGVGIGNDTGTHDDIGLTQHAFGDVLKVEIYA